MLFTLLTWTLYISVSYLALHTPHVHIKRITWVKFNHINIKQCYISILDDTTVTQLGYNLYLILLAAATPSYTISILPLGAILKLLHLATDNIFCDIFSTVKNFILQFTIATWVSNLLSGPLNVHVTVLVGVTVCFQTVNDLLSAPDHS